MNAVAALAYQPKEPWALWIEACHRDPVACEGSEARPFVGDAIDTQRGRGLEPVDRKRNVDFFGLGVAGGCRRLVGR